MHDEPSYTITFTGTRGPIAPRVAQPMHEAVSETLRLHRVIHATIHVQVVNDASIRGLNQRYLDHPRATDVLTFDLGDEVGTDDGNGRVEGDIVVSRETAAREARVREHRVADELALYAVHGTLHLLGYEDRTAAQARRMHRMEDRILGGLGLGTIFAGRQRSFARPKARKTTRAVVAAKESHRS